MLTSQKISYSTASTPLAQTENQEDYQQEAGKERQAL